MKKPEPIAERMQLIEGQWVKIKIYAPHESGTYGPQLRKAKRGTSYQKFRSAQVVSGR